MLHIPINKLSINNTRRILKLAIIKAKKKYPKGFNKIQLVDIAEQIREKEKIGDPVLFGKIANNNDIEKQRSNMITQGDYPAGITDCEVVGINGDCGLECPVFRRGDCKNVEECPKEWVNDYKDKLKYFIELYPILNKFLKE